MVKSVRSNRARRSMGSVVAMMPLVLAGASTFVVEADQACDTSEGGHIQSDVQGGGVGATVGDAIAHAMANAVGAEECAATCTDDTRCSADVTADGGITLDWLALLPGGFWAAGVTVHPGDWKQVCNPCP